MKRFYSLLSFLLIGMAAVAQFQNISVQGLMTPKTPSVGKAAGTYPDSSSVYAWDFDRWEIKTTKVYTYDAANRVASILEYNATTDTFMYKYTYSYDAKDHPIYILQEAEVNGSLVPYNRYITTYDSEWNRTSYIQETYVNSQWEIDEGDSIAYVYDAQKRVTEMTLNQLSGTTVYPVQKLLWSDYQSDDLPHTLAIQAYQNGYFNYVKLDRLTWNAGFDYIDFNPTSFYGWFWQNSDWEEVTFDTTDVVDGRIQTSYLFMINGTSLDSSSKTEYLYDKMGLEMQELTYQYQGNSWAPTSGTRDSIEYGSYDEKQKRTLSYFAQADKVWMPIEEERFFYNSLSLKKTENLALNIFPNPTNTYAHLALPNDQAIVHVFTMQGQEIQVPMDGNKLDCQGLKAGIYFILVESGNNTFTGRLQVQH